VAVRDDQGPVVRLNELEYIDGLVYANVWQTDRIAQIDPENGQVVGWIDLSGLLTEDDFAQMNDQLNPSDDPNTENWVRSGGVLNGIAYDAERDRLFVTGKLWPKLVEIELVLADEAPAEAPLDLGSTVDVQTVAEVKDRDDVFVIDVREQWEYDEGHIPGVILIPMNDVPARLDEIPKDKEVIVTCRSGNRSSQVTQFLRDQGFENVHNMDGGIRAWEAAGLDVEK
jgi:rhodanese-related sulfurtransferase